MKVLSKEGMVFGKINIIDLFIIVFVVAVLAIGVIKITEKKAATYITPAAEFEMDIILKNLYGGFEKKVAVGDMIYDNKTGKEIGKVTVVNITPAIQEVTTSDGRVVRTEVPNRSDCIITIAGKGVYSKDKGLMVGDELRYVAYSLTLRNDRFLNAGVIGDIRMLGDK